MHVVTVRTVWRWPAVGSRVWLGAEALACAADAKPPRMWLSAQAVTGGSEGVGQSSPENRSQAACLETPRAAPMRVQLTLRERSTLT
jgi:hypothetical protein